MIHIVYNILCDIYNRLHPPVNNLVSHKPNFNHKQGKTDLHPRSHPHPPKAIISGLVRPYPSSLSHKVMPLLENVATLGLEKNRGHSGQCLTCLQNADSTLNRPTYFALLIHCSDSDYVGLVGWVVGSSEVSNYKSSNIIIIINDTNIWFVTLLR